MKSDNNSHFIEGKRIFLREINLNDVNENFYRWMNSSETNKYLETRFYPLSIDTLEEEINEALTNHEEIPLAIVIKKGKRHIGNIKLYNIDWIHRLAEIGIIIGEQDCWNKGYAKEGIDLIKDYAFNTLNIHKLTATCYEPNQASVKAFSKAGFEIEGIRKSHFFYQGKYLNAVLFGLINSTEK